MDGMKTLFTKYHSYILAVIAAGLVATQVVLQFMIPDFAWEMLGAAGLTSLRFNVSPAAGGGWKTYVSALALALEAAAQAAGYPIPPALTEIVAAAGLGSLGAATLKTQSAVS